AQDNQRQPDYQRRYAPPAAANPVGDRWQLGEPAPVTRSPQPARQLRVLGGRYGLKTGQRSALFGREARLAPRAHPTSPLLLPPPLSLLSTTRCVIPPILLPSASLKPA